MSDLTAAPVPPAVSSERAEMLAQLRAVAAEVCAAFEGEFFAAETSAAVECWLASMSPCSDFRLAARLPARPPCNSPPPSPSPLDPFRLRH